MEQKDVRVDLIEDRPDGGMWHCGPNPCWVTVTHLPTGASVRVYSGGKAQYKAREDAYNLLEMAVDVAIGETPRFMERL